MYGVKLGPPLTFSMMVVNRNTVANRPKVLSDFLRSYKLAWAYLSEPANKAATIKLLMQKTTTSPDNATVDYDASFRVRSGQKIPAVNPEGIGTVLRFSGDRRQKTASPDQFIDNSLL